MKCPSPVELERGFWTDDREIRGHAEACPSCRPAWTEIGELADLGRSIEPEPTSPARREELRTTLLARLERRPERAPASRWPLVAAPLAAAAAVALAWWAWTTGAPTPPAAAPAPAPTAPAAPTIASHGQLLDHGGARFLRATEPPDEIVRLVDGTISLQVDPLGPGERFRVFTGDAELRVSDATLDVTAERDKLVAVRVVHGVVEVLPAGGEPAQIRAGDTWRATLVDGPPTAVIDSPPRRRAAKTPAAPAVPPPDPAQGAFDDGWRAVQAGDFTAAADAFERATGTSDTQLTEDAAYWRAVALARAGEPDDAILAFEAFLAAHPRAARAGEASAVLGWLLYDRGDREAAARRFRAAADDASPRVRRSAAEGLRALGQEDS
jgi:hypothetical protein